MSDIDRPLLFSGKVDQAGVCNEIRELAEKIAKIHGPVKIAAEKSGIHIYFPSPYVVELEGIKEVYRAYPHGTINAEKFLGLGRFARTKTSRNAASSSALCMKTDRPINVQSLLSDYAPIEERVKQKVDCRVTEGSVDREIHLVTDRYGERVPRGPGHLIPVTELDYSHPARIFLRERKMDERREELVKMFGLSFCDKEEPEDRATGVYYKKLAAGFKDTPQGRLVFQGFMYGSRVAWQARIIAINPPDDPDTRWFLHPYELKFFPMEKKVAGKWVYNTAMGAGRWDKHYSKYRTAPGASRNDILFGLDAAIEYNRQVGNFSNPKVMVVEGPLDAGRMGSPCIPFLGSSMSAQQVRLLENNFRELLLIADNDKAGEKLVNTCKKMLAGSSLKLTVEDISAFAEDPGSLSDARALWIKSAFMNDAAPAVAGMRITA